MAQTDADFDKQMAKERQFYTGKTDVDPNTGLTLAEAQAEHLKLVSDFEKKEAESHERLHKESLGVKVKSEVETVKSETEVKPNLEAEKTKVDAKK